VLALSFDSALNKPSIIYGSRFSNTSKNLTISIRGGADVMTFDNAGNVGIGTTAPGTRLQTSGTIRSTGVGPTPPSSGDEVFGAEIYYSSGVGYFLSLDRTDNNPLASHFGGSGVSGIRVATSGYVGIGTTNPNEKLTVEGNISASGNLIITGSTKFSAGSNTLATTSTKYVIVSEVTSSFKSAFYDYFVSSGSNLRAGSIISVFTGSNVSYYEVATADIGNTQAVTMSVGLNNSMIQLSSSVSSTTGWLVKATVRYI